MPQLSAAIFALDRVAHRNMNVAPVAVGASLKSTRRHGRTQCPPTGRDARIFALCVGNTPCRLALWPDLPSPDLPVCQPRRGKKEPPVPGWEPVAMAPDGGSSAMWREAAGWPAKVEEWSRPVANSRPGRTLSGNTCSAENSASRRFKTCTYIAVLFVMFALGLGFESFAAFKPCCNLGKLVGQIEVLPSKIDAHHIFGNRRELGSPAAIVA